MTNLYTKFLPILLFFLFSCEKKLEITPVSNFDVLKYSGLWHEIARTDNKFEKGCKNVTANYELRLDGGIDVVNTCEKDGKIKTAKGVAYFRGDKTIGTLKVSFFWPFYGRYDILYIDDYKYAIVYGGKPEYIWILARERKIEDDKLKKLLEKIKNLSLDKTTLLLQQ